MSVDVLIYNKVTNTIFFRHSDEYFRGVNIKDMTFFRKFRKELLNVRAMVYKPRFLVSHVVVLPLMMIMNEE